MAFHWKDYEVNKILKFTFYWKALTDLKYL